MSLCAINLSSWPQMGKAGREFVCENYDIKKLNQRLFDLYQELLNNNEDNKL